MELGVRIGMGQTAEVFEWGPDRVVKLHYDWVPSEWVLHQLEVDRLIASTGVPCPRVFESVKIDGRLGIIYDRVRGTSMLRLLESSPQTTLQCARKMAGLHVQMHQTVSPIPSTQKKDLREAILQSEAEFDALTFTKLLHRLETLPDGQSVCHGDFHPDNILITQNGDSVIVDWTNAVIGHPMADVARAYLTLSTPFIPPNIGTIGTIALKIIKPMFRRTYIHEYRRRTRSSMSEFQVWLPVVSAARLRENLPGEKDWLMRVIQDGIKEA